MDNLVLNALAYILGFAIQKYAENRWPGINWDTLGLIAGGAAIGYDLACFVVRP